MPNTRKDHRRAMSFTLMTSATVLAMASAAFACTHFRGTMTLTGDYPTANPGSVTAVGLSQNGGMNHCADPRTNAAAKVNGLRNPTVAGGSAIGGITISTGPATCSATNGGPSQLSPGTYTVSWNEAYANDCMAQVGGFPTAILGTFTVGANGVGGPQSYTVPAEEASFDDYAGVCITSTTQPGAFQGNRAPLKVV